MPNNNRPGGIFGEMDYNWKGTTLAERRIAQNQWDLLEAQEEANKIEERKLQMQEKIYNLQKEQKEQENQNKKESVYYNICKEVGINYYNTKNFVERLKIVIDDNKENELYPINNFLHYNGLDNIKATRTMLNCCLAVGIFFIVPICAFITTSTLGTILGTLLISTIYLILVDIFTKLRIRFNLNKLGINSVKEGQIKLNEYKEYKQTIVERRLQEFYKFRQNNYNYEIEKALQDTHIEVEPVKYEDIPKDIKPRYETINEFNKYILSKQFN